MINQKVPSLHTYACGHKRTYWTVVKRNRRHRFPCGPCAAREGRVMAEFIPGFLDGAHGLFANFARCVRQAGEMQRERSR